MINLLASTKIGDITIRFRSRTSWQPDGRPFPEILPRRRQSTTARPSSMTMKIRAILILVLPEAPVFGLLVTRIITGSSAVSNVPAESEQKVLGRYSAFKSIMEPVRQSSWRLDLKGLFPLCWKVFTVRRRTVLLCIVSMVERVTSTDKSKAI